MSRFARYRISAACAALLLSACASNQEPGAEATPTELIQWADERVADGDLDPAIVGYRRALGSDSLNVTAMVGLARVYELQDRPEPADGYRRRAFHVRYEAGLRQISAGNLDSARLALQQAVRIMPRHPLAHLRLGELQRSSGRLDSAIVHFEQAVEANPNFAEGHIILGQAYEAAHRPDDARQAYERALEVNINALDAYLGLGRIFRDKGEWAAAASQYEKVLLIDPRSADGTKGLREARTHLRQGR